MTRPLAVALGLLAASAADAQPQPRPADRLTPPGYIAIRVRLGSDGTAPANPGPGMPPGAGGAGPFAPPGMGGPGVGGPGMPPGMGGPGGPGTASDEKSLVVTIPHKGIFKRLVHPEKRFNENTNPMWEPVVRTEYGESLLLWDTALFQGHQVKDPQVPGRDLPLLADDLKKKHDKDVMNGGAKRNEKMFDLIRVALEENQVEVAMQYAKELVKWTEVKDPSKPDEPAPKNLPPHLAFVKAFKEIEPKLAETLAPPASAASWKERLKAANVASKGHYALLNFGDRVVSNDVVFQRFDALERNFKAFYLLHALHGVALPFPERQLLVLLVPETKDLTAYHGKLDGGPIASDAFYSPTHDVLVLSPTRSDELALSFIRSAQDHYRNGWNRADLLKGKAPPASDDTSPSEVARVMTYALVHQALEDEGVAAAVTGAGTRQLYATIGKYPKYVQLPDWLEYGLTSLLQKPKDHGVETVAGKPSMVLGIKAGYGSPNYLHYRQFRDFYEAKDLPEPAELLARVLTDKYFDAWRGDQDLDGKIGLPVPGRPPAGAPGGIAPGGMPSPLRPGGGGSLGGRDDLAQQPPPPPPPGGPRGPGMPGVPGNPVGDTIDTEPSPAAKREAKAQATAWALVYFLTRNQETKTDGKETRWENFLARLQRMPRDMKLDRQLVLREFALAYGLTKNGEADPAIDQFEFKKFAEEWVKYVLSASKTWQVEKVREEQQNPGGIPPGGPGMPPLGGPRGPGGPGRPGGGK